MPYYIHKVFNFHNAVHTLFYLWWNSALKSDLYFRKYELRDASLHRNSTSVWLHGFDCTQQNAIELRSVHTHQTIETRCFLFSCAKTSSLTELPPHVPNTHSPIYADVPIKWISHAQTVCSRNTSLAHY